MKEYTLLQRLPNLHEGAIFLYDPLTSKFVSKGVDKYGEYTYYDEQVLIDNPKWFRYYDKEDIIKEFTLADMRKCWNAAKTIDGKPIGRIETFDGDCGDFCKDLYPKFENYLKTIK